MAQRTGLEPATSAVTGRHSNQLNYRCNLKSRNHAKHNANLRKKKVKESLNRGGRYKARTYDIHLVRVALYQLS